jgi:hypothetical protein
MTTAGSASGVNVMSWDRCYDFKNIFAEKFSEKISVFDSKNFEKKLIITLVFKKNDNFWPKIGEKRRKL